MTTVLVVDDSAVDRALVKGILEEGSSVAVTFADDGADALSSIGNSQPDIVVTDLHMPNLNGLQLVQSIHTDYPNVPVVLITGQGSEELAVKALQCGAASYVPKTVLKRDLLSTVMHVLAVARTKHNYERLQACWRQTSSRFELENDHLLIAPLVGTLRQMVQGMGLFDETEQVQLGMALEEAINNALYHGNLELSKQDLANVEYDLFDNDSPNLIDQRKSKSPYRDRKIHVEAVLTQTEAKFVIRDEGPGFDPASVPSPGKLVAADDGRGITHMRLFSDEIIYNDRANEVTLIKRR